MICLRISLWRCFWNLEIISMHDWRAKWIPQTTKTRVHIPAVVCPASLGYSVKMYSTIWAGLQGGAIVDGTSFEESRVTQIHILIMCLHFLLFPWTTDHNVHSKLRVQIWAVVCPASLGYSLNIDSTILVGVQQRCPNFFHWCPHK